MKKIAYLECPTGIAGDMCLGALVDMDVPLEYLIEQLRQLNIEQEYHLWAEKVHRNGQAATKVHVDLLKEGEKIGEEATFHHGDRHSYARHLPEIERLLQSASLPPRALQWSLQVFRQLAVAEGAVHGIAPEKVHFHEVGATDAIVDIVGTCLGLDWLGIDELHCSPLPTGGGMVRVAHGRLPVPVPAVLKLWEMRQVPVYSNGIDKELVTPTGAAIATTLATRFGAPPSMTIERIGLGAGTAQLVLPNLLRLWLGTVSPSPAQQEVAVLETQIDDASPQAIAYAMDALFQTGALDVFTSAIAMKKSRLGTLLTVICQLEKVAECEAVLFKETTTIGIRHSIQQRSILQREIQPIETVYGTVRIKVASEGEGEQHKILNVHPEYEDCAQLAKQHGVPWLTIHQTALETWHHERGSRFRGGKRARGKGKRKV